MTTADADAHAAPGSAARPPAPQHASGPLWRLARRIALIAAAVLLATGTAVALTAAHGGAPARPDPPAKPFTVPRLGGPGSEISLAAYAGRPVIINFFASWCAPCKRETPLLARFFRAHHGAVIVLGIDANDHAAAAQQFMRGAGVSYPVGFDPSATVTTSYGVAALPQTFFLNARHLVVRHVFGAVPAGLLRSWAAGLAAGSTRSG